MSVRDTMEWETYATAVNAAFDREARKLARLRRRVERAAALLEDLGELADTFAACDGYEIAERVRLAHGALLDLESYLDNRNRGVSTSPNPRA